MQQQPWIEKYRPTSLDKIIHQEHVVESLKAYTNNNNAETIPHMLFHSKSGSGKCLDPDTIVTMHDCTFRKAKDVLVGEMLMGDDGTKRIVLGTCFGTDIMYNIIQSNSDSYIVNEPHVLTLMHNYEPVDIDLLKYLEMDDAMKKEYEGYKIGVRKDGLDFNYFICSDIRIELLGLGAYCGFELSGNGRFLLGDFTVTHNTSIALALVNQWFEPSERPMRVLELNASDERGIATIRKKVKTFAEMNVHTNSNPKTPPFKFVILDEADSLTVDAQASLRRIMEDYSAKTRFCLMCNYLSRIIDPIVSRCAVFAFHPIPIEKTIIHLKFISESEGVVNMDDSIIRKLVQLTDGDLRQSIQMVQFIHQTNSNPTIPLIYEITGHVPEEFVDMFFVSCMQGDYELSVWMEQFVKNGFSTSHLLEQLSEKIWEQSWNDTIKALFCVELNTVHHAISCGSSAHLQLQRPANILLNNKL